MRFTWKYLFALMLLSCDKPGRSYTVIKRVPADSVVDAGTSGLSAASGRPITTIDTKTITPAQLVAFARTLNGVPYKYGSTDPSQGFDCSGFVTYVFNHFNIAVPRSSADFAAVNHQIDLKDAKTGDLILFTGTDSTIKTVGHMGILIADPGSALKFIHSTSGKAQGVTETPVNAYYQGRYMKTIRIFSQNNQ